MLQTGIRRSELLGLKWSGVDFHEKLLHVQRAVVQTRGKIPVGAPKTETSNRYIPLPATFCDWLLRQPYRGEYIMGTDEPQSPSTYSGAFQRFMREMRSDIDVPILTPHELRHTFGTLLREAGVDIYTIQRVMGHSDITVTLNIYSHLLQDASDDACSVAEGILSKKKTH